MLFHCKSCKVTYDGNAQCCMDMDHVQVESFYDHLEEIRGFVKSNPELLRRLEAMERIYQEEILLNEETANDRDKLAAEIENRDQFDEEIQNF